MIYTLSLDMAKELAMVAKNDAGKRVRRYFIDCERRAMGMGEISTESSVDAGTNLSELEAELCRPSSFREALESTVLYWTLDKHNLIDYPQIPREVVWGVTKDINRSIRRDIYLDILAKFGAAAVRACDPEIISYLFQRRPGYARVRNHVS